MVAAEERCNFEVLFWGKMWFDRNGVGGGLVGKVGNGDGYLVFVKDLADADN